MRKFDKKFGRDFLSSIPPGPGIYKIFDTHEALIYVGKAKNLRRRISQYRNAKRRKKHMKMRHIVSDAARLEYVTCKDELEACLLEMKTIQEHRPKWNVAGAFYFLYPMIGIRYENEVATFCYTTSPEQFSGFRFHGAFRSRYLTREAFFSLMGLLNFIGHRMPRSQKKDRYSRVYSFRQIRASWIESLERFLRGESAEAIEALVLTLVENAAARKARREIQEQLDWLKRFWKHEATALAKMRTGTRFTAYPIPQTERDLMFLRYKHRSSSAVAPAHHI